MLLTNVMVDGVMTDVKAEIYGNGEDDSLAPGESQTARISLSLAEGEEFEVVTFNIVVTDLMGEEVGTVEVTCRNPGGSMPEEFQYHIIVVWLTMTLTRRKRI